MKYLGTICTTMRASGTETDYREVKACRGLDCTSTSLIQAHIIPKGFARIARGEGHVVSIGERKPAVAKRQHGVFDASILCAKCDSRLGRFDDYLVEFCKTFPKRQKQFSRLGFQVNNIDASLLRKGVLAILWRASISNRPECQGISLGSYEDRARDVLFGAVPIDQFHHFEIVVQRYTIAWDGPVGFYTYPYRTRYDGLNVYVFGLVGLRILAKMDARPFPPVLHDFIVGRSPHLLGINMGFDETSEGRALRKKANPF